MVVSLLGGWEQDLDSRNQKGPKSLGRTRKKRKQWTGSWGLEGAANSEKNSSSGSHCSCVPSQFYQSQNGKFPWRRNMPLNASYTQNV